VSDNGDVSGVMIAHDAKANMIQNTMSVGHQAYGNAINSVVNTTPGVYGYRIFDGVQATRIHNCVAQAFSAPRYVYGFYVGKTEDAVVTSCISSSHSVNDETNLNDNDNKKEAIGFHAFDTKITRFEDCITCNIRVQGEGDDDSSKSHVAGFAIQQEKAGNEDHYSSILNCRSEAHDGGRGTSFGVYLYDANYVTVRGCTAVNNYGRKGYMASIKQNLVIVH
jgi:hypothetical protein